MHAETRRGTESRNVLMDFGFTPEALLNNTDLLGIDPAGLDALVLSHGHYDHFGGLAGFLRANNGKLKPKLPIYIGGEEAVWSREWTAPPVRGDFGALDRKAMEDANLMGNGIHKAAINQAESRPREIRTQAQTIGAVANDQCWIASGAPHALAVDDCDRNTLTVRRSRTELIEHIAMPITPEACRVLLAQG